MFSPDISWSGLTVNLCGCERRHDGCGFVTSTVADVYFAGKVAHGDLVPAFGNLTQAAKLTLRRSIPTSASSGQYGWIDRPLFRTDRAKRHGGELGADRISARVVPLLPLVWSHGGLLRQELETAGYRADRLTVHSVRNHQAFATSPEKLGCPYWHIGSVRCRAAVGRC